jgi:hypothetical protein
VKRWGNPATRTGNATTWENTADHYVQIFRDGGDIWWVIAPDAALAQKMVAAAK